jgi:hypothetical protein
MRRPRRRPRRENDALVGYRSEVRRKAWGSRERQILPTRFRARRAVQLPSDA